MVEDLDGGTEGFLGIPSISLRSDRVVVADRGAYQRLSSKNKPIRPLDLINVLFQSFDVVHILDLDGHEKGSANISFIQKASQIGEVWVDPGMRSSETLIDMFMAGAGQCVISSRTLGNLHELVNAYEMSEDIVFQLDYDGKKIMARSETLFNMKLKEVISEVKDIGISRFILADYSRLENNNGPNLKLFNRLKKRFSDIELFAAVGVVPHHLPLLEDAGLSGAVLDLRSVMEEYNILFDP